MRLSSDVPSFHSESMQQNRSTDSNRTSSKENRTYSSSFTSEFASYSQSNADRDDNANKNVKAKNDNEGAALDQRTITAPQTNQPVPVRQSQGTPNGVPTDPQQPELASLLRGHVTSLPSTSAPVHAKESAVNKTAEKPLTRNTDSAESGDTAIPLLATPGQEDSVLLTKNGITALKNDQEQQGLPAGGMGIALPKESPIQERNNAPAQTGELALAIQASAGEQDSGNAQVPLALDAVSQTTQGAMLKGEADPRRDNAQQRQQGKNTEGPVATESLTMQPAQDGTHTPRTDEASSNRTADLETQLEKFRSEPVKGAHVQITGANNQQIDIRMIERGGALSVTVRSNDANTTKTLQEHASELSTRLTQEHYQTQVWTPHTAATTDTRGSGNGGANPDRHSSSQQQQGNKQEKQPDWVEELERNPIVSQKRIEYIWQQ